MTNTLPRRELLARRDFLALAGAALGLAHLPGAALAAPPADRSLHGLSAFGDLKYAPDFTHFDYASPDAPAGGTFNFAPPNWGFNQNVLTFNTLNSFVSRGDAPPRMELCFDALMTRALDEPDALYGLVAQTVTISPDRNSFTFALRPQARFHDGTKLTAHDVAFSYSLFKEKGHPSLLLPLTHMREAVAIDDHTFRIGFSGRRAPSWPFRSFRSSRGPFTRPIRSTVPNSGRRSARAPTRSAGSSRGAGSNMTGSRNTGRASCRSPGGLAISAASASSSIRSARPVSRPSRRAK